MIPTLYELKKQSLEIQISRMEGDGSATDPLPPFTAYTPPDAGSTTTTALIDNLLEGTDFDYSKDAYVNDPAIGGDEDEETYNWYRHRLIKVSDVVATAASPTIESASAPVKAAYTYPMNFVLYGAGGTEAQTLTGTLTRVDDETATLSTNALATLTAGTLFFGETLAESTATAIKATDHSLFAATEGADEDIPRWNKESGWLEGGSMDEPWSLDSPLSQNHIKPSLTLYIQAIIRVRETAEPDGVQLYFGIWDATAAQQRWLEGSNFTLNVTPVGTTGGTSVSYKAVAILNDGSAIESPVVTIANSNAVLSGSNYNRLTWTNAPGIQNFTIYRLMGGVYKRIFTITNGSSDYNDTGGDEATVSGWPSTSTARPYVYKETEVLLPTVSTWLAVQETIIVPNTYNMQNTTGKQWFRMGIVGETADERNILIDRVGLSLSPGGWNKSVKDRFAVSQVPTSTPVGSDQGSIGIQGSPWKQDPTDMDEGPMLIE